MILYYIITLALEHLSGDTIKLRAIIHVFFIYTNRGVILLGLYNSYKIYFQN